MKIARFLIASALAGLALPLPAARPAATETQLRTRSLYLQLIHQARADGRPRAAIAYLDDFDRQFPGDIDARVLRANSLLDLGQVDAAQAAVDTLARSPASAGLDAVRGHVRAARGQWATSIPFYEAAVAANPTDPLLRNALGYALLRSRSPDRAIEQLRGAADLAPQDDVIRNNLILAFTLGGRTTEADDAIARLRDRTAQAALRRQIAAEVARPPAPRSPPEKRPADMLILLLSAQAAAAASSPPPPPAPVVRSEARTVMEAQLASPPRTGRAGGLTPEEADAVTAAYAASIGKRMTVDRATPR